MSVNIELPSEASLTTLAPNKSKSAILAPMGQIQSGIPENVADLVMCRHAPRFAPAGQCTQMIVGATPESDLQILHLTEALYRKYSLKRVFFSAYMPVVQQLPPPLSGHQAALAPGAPAVPGGLAPAVLRL